MFDLKDLLKGKNNKMLLAISGIVIVLIIVGIIFAITALTPFFSKGVDYVSQKGIKGVVNDTSGMAKRIWEGKSETDNKEKTDTESNTKN